MDLIRIREWAGLTYHPVNDLYPKLRDLQIAVAQSDTEDVVKNLRTRGLTKYREGWNACIFLRGISKIFGFDHMSFALAENDDYDVIARRFESDTHHFTPIQLKEYRMRPQNKRSLEEELKKLTKYTDSEDLIVAYWMSGAQTMDFDMLRIPELRIGELWFFGCTAPDQSEWFLFGDALKSPFLHQIKIT